MNASDPVDSYITTLLALIPPPVSLDTVISTTGESAVVVLQIIENLCDCNILRPSKSLGAGYYRFQKESERNQIIQKSKNKEIVGIAQKLVAFFETSQADDVEKWQKISAVQLTAGIKPESLQPLLKSTLFYFASGAQREAFKHFQSVWELMRDFQWDLSDEKLFLEATIKMLSKIYEVFPYTEQKNMLQLASGIAQNHENWSALANLHSYLGYIALREEGDSDKAAQLFEKGKTFAAKSKDKNLILAIALRISELQLRQGLISEALKSYESSLGNREDFPENPAILRSCARLGRVYVIAGQVARGMGLTEAILQKAVSCNLPEVVIYINIILILIYIDVGRIDEAEILLDELLSKPESEIGLFHLCMAKSAMAYILYRKNDLPGCALLHREVCEDSKKLGTFHHKGVWQFEYMRALENEGLIHPERTCDTEITHILNDPDVFMKGIALRIRALFHKDDPDRKDSVKKDFAESERLLRQSGAKLELANTQIEIVRFEDNLVTSNASRERLRSAWELISDIDADLFPSDLKHHVTPESRETFLIRTIIEVGNSLGTIRDLEQLLKRIIDFVLNLVHAERGGFFIEEEGKLEFLASRNMDQNMVASESFSNKCKLIRQVSESGNEIIDNIGTSTTKSKSNKKSNQWFIISPLKLQDNVLGVLFLEGGDSGYAPRRSDLNLLKAIGNQVAMALDNARAYAEIAELRDRLKEENRLLVEEVASIGKMQGIIGESPAIRKVLKDVRQVCSTDSTALITGETGVGKELVARSIHRLSPRGNGSFIPINVASLPEDLVASELFGHEKGSFTGAIAAKRGRFELAAGGTLFLDDVQNLSLNIQAKLLRVIQEMEFERIGGTKTIKADFRLLVATNIDLAELVNRKEFRSDLFYRLNVYPVQVPALRERTGDIPLLAMHFLKIFSDRFSKEIKGISKPNMEQLIHYSWPGNVRELQHVIERAVIQCDTSIIKSPILPESESVGLQPEAFVALKDKEREYIISALKHCQGRVSGKNGAAKLLSVKPSTLYSKIRRLGISKEVIHSPE